MAVAGGIPVHSHVPENSPYPMIIVGDIEDLAPIGRDDDPDRRGQLTVISLTDGEERKPCADMVAKVEGALAGKTLASGGWIIRLSLVRTTVTLAEDGLGYVGLAQFGVIALN